MTDIVEVSVDEVRDDRTFTQRVFLSPELKPYQILIVDASSGEPDYLPEDKIVILRKYKHDIVRGRKDPLKGRNVLCLPSDKGHIKIPLEEALPFANLLQALAEKLNEQLNGEKTPKDAAPIT